MKVAILYTDSYEIVDCSKAMVSTLINSTSKFENGVCMGLSGYHTLYEDENGSVELLYQDGVSREDDTPVNNTMKKLGFNNCKDLVNLIVRMSEDWKDSDLLDKDIEWIESKLKSYV